MKTRAADQRDVENAEAWAAIIEDLLFLAPPDRRAAILAVAVQTEEAARRDRETNPFQITKFADIDLNTPGHRHWNAVLRLKGLLVQVFVRDVTSTNSSTEAADLLFAHQRFGTGSGRLSEYLELMPPPESR